MLRTLQVDVADGTAHTNSTTEAAIASYTVPASFFQPGKVLKFEAVLDCPSTNSTDTLTVVVYLGATTLTTAIASGPATDVANDDHVCIEGTVVCRDADSSSTLECFVRMSDPGANGTSLEAYYTELTTVDTTAALLLEVGADWSVASASNQVQTVLFNVFEIV